MTTFTDIEASFAPHAERAAKWFEDRITKIFNELAREDGMIYREDIGRDAWSSKYRKYYTIIRFVKYTGVGSFNDPMILNVSWLKQKAEEFGNEQVASYVAKLRRKIGHLTEVELKLGNNGEFTIYGVHNEDKVRVDQQVVFKTSSKGTFFLQWPARIYVNGKFTTEKKFVEMK